MKSSNKYRIFSGNINLIEEIEILIDDYLAQYPMDRAIIIESVRSVFDISIEELKDKLAERKGRRIKFVTSKIEDRTYIEFEEVRND